MSRDADLNGPARRGHITTQQHFPDPLRSAVVKSGRRDEAFRVVERTQQQVKQRQIGVIASVYPTLVVTRVTFRALNEITQPLGCAQVTVLKNGHEGGHQHDEGSGLWGNTNDHRETEATQCRPTDHIHRTEPEGAIRIETLRAVMHLMEDAPQQVGPMHRAVPNVDTEFIDEQTRHRAAGRTQPCQVE